MNCNVDFKTIGERIKAAREQRGWSREGLAGRIGYSYGAVVQWETDHHAPHDRAIRSLEQAFKMKLRK